MNRDVYKYILSTYGRNPGQWFGFLAEIARTILSRIVTIVIMASAVTNLAAGDFEAAKSNVLWFLAVFVAAATIGAIGEIVSVHTENLEYEKLSVGFHKKLTSKDMSFYRDNQTGYLASVFRQHLDSMMQFVRLIRGEVTRAAVSLVAPISVLWVADWRLGSIALVIVIIQLFYITWASKRMNKYRAQAHEIYRKITGEVADEITNIVAYKSSGMEDRAESRIHKLAKEETATFMVRKKMGVILDYPRSLITAFGVTAAFYIVVSSSKSDPAQIGLIVLTLTYMFQILRNIGELPNLLYQHDDLTTKIYPTLEYLKNENEDIKDPQSPKTLGRARGEINIDSVDFEYRSSGKYRNTSVFKNLNIHIKAGEQVGVVGLSGAGKSTLASLLMRFDDVTGGSINIDGTDIREIKQGDLRQNIAYIPQEPLLFHRSVKENIAYFRENTKQADIARAAKAAHADEFIKDLPDGYNTIVGERGVKVSGGQKQRIVIARAILKNAPIMLFDEATSALDSESEKIIQNALPEIIGKRTAIVIAHRLSTVAGLDRIIVMHEGKIIEEGTHQQLLAQEGRYYSLWQKQIHEEL